MSKYLLVISTFNNTPTEHVSLTFSNIFSQLLNISHSNIIHYTLPSNTVYFTGSYNNITTQDINHIIYTFIYTALLDNPYECKLYIYINNHSHNTLDSNGNTIEQQEPISETLPEIETYINTDNLTEIINNAILQSNTLERPFIFLITASTNTFPIIDKITTNYFDWIHLSLNENEDTSTHCLINVLHKQEQSLLHINAIQLLTLLYSEIKQSVTNKINPPTLYLSHQNMTNFTLFS